MKTVTVSTRLETREARRLDAAAEEEGLDRASFLKQLIRRGFADVQYERACDAYRRGHVTLSRAAQIAGLSVRDFMLRMPDSDLEISYGPQELEKDLADG